MSVRPPFPAGGNYSDNWFESGGGAILRGKEVFPPATRSRPSRLPLSSPAAMEITAGFHMRRTGRRPWSDFQDFPCRPTICRTSSWVVRLGTPSAVSLCCGSSRSPLAVRFGLLLATCCFGSGTPVGAVDHRRHQGDSPRDGRPPRGRLSDSHHGRGRFPHRHSLELERRVLSDAALRTLPLIGACAYAVIRASRFSSPRTRPHVSIS